MFKIVSFADSYIDDILDVWNSEVGFIFPIFKKLFIQNTINSQYFVEEASFVAISDNKVIGFVIAKKYDNDFIIPKYLNKGWISLIYVKRNWRKHGVGNILLTKAESYLKKLGVTSISVGSDIDNFFPGIPGDFDNLTADFFERRGYNIGKYTHDLIYRGSGEFELLKTDVVLRYATMLDKDEVLKFFKKNFPGRWEYEALKYFENGQIASDYLLALMNQTIVGFLRVNDKSIDYIPYNITWQKRFNNLGGLGPLGVDKDFRGHGIARQLLFYAINDLQKKGITEIMIDWTGLMAIYQKYGFEVWKCYQYCSKQIK